MLCERYSFVALTTKNLKLARDFWIGALGFVVTEEEPEHFFIVDAGGLRLCIDAEDGAVHVAGGTDPVIGLKVESVERALATLRERGVLAAQGPVEMPRKGGHYAVVRDPDGRAVILTEAD